MYMYNCTYMYQDLCTITDLIIIDLTSGYTIIASCEWLPYDYDARNSVRSKGGRDNYKERMRKSHFDNM